jgi:uncharacterized protein VirK/YbjX
MVFAHLTRHWLARRHYSLPSWLACIARSLRVLLFYREHARLLTLDVYRKHLTQVHDDVFHHLSHRHFLVKGLTLRQRVQCVSTHYRFEEAVFDAAYQRAVYRDGGLVLWRHEADGREFTIRLEMAPRLAAEGDLMLVLSAGGQRLHRLTFSWVDFDLADPAGLAGPEVVPELVPFIACNQGRRADALDAFAAFERAFPNNSPSFFCFAALQGVALALDMDQIVAVKAAWQCASKRAEARHLANAYDGFWQTLGGVDLAGRGYRIALPFHVKPLSEMPSKHRKRAALRREHWRAIGESAGASLLRHLRRKEAPADSSQVTAPEPSVTA